MEHGGTNPQKITRVYIDGTLGFSNDKVFAVLAPLSCRETDFCFRSEVDYIRFWKRYRDVRAKTQNS